MSRIKQDLLKELFKNGLVYTENCSEEENKKYNNLEDGNLPENIEQTDSTDVPPTYFKYVKEKLTDEEMKLYLLAKQNSTLKTIKGCIVFFVVLAVIGIILGFIGVFQISNIIH